MMCMAAVIWCTVFAVLAHGGVDIPSVAAEMNLNMPYISNDADFKYSQVMVRRVNETLMLTCNTERYPDLVTWYLPNGQPVLSNDSDGRVSASGARLLVRELRIEDTGHYTCSLPPHNVRQYILVQPPALTQCGRGYLSCGWLCVLPLYVCDGVADCVHGEDESLYTCGTPYPCLGMLQCEEGRCLSPGWCLRPSVAQHSCCELHTSPEPPLASDTPRPHPDYSLIQSTIYTVTACALIFMVAVVLLVSAICKMHLKRAALREYARAHPHALYPPSYTHPSHQMCEERRQRADSCVERLLSRLALQPHYTAGCAREVRRSGEGVTLRLGRLRVSVPRLTPRNSASSLHTELQALRGGDTYTLNGRTIRLLGAEVECGAPPPPPYSPARAPSAAPVAPLKPRGPPPQYLSTDHLENAAPAAVAFCEPDGENEAPPGYEHRII